MSGKKFSVRRGLKKSIRIGLAVALGVASGVEIAGGVANIENLTLATGIGAAVGGLRFALNWWKVNGETQKIKR